MKTNQERNPDMRRIILLLALLVGWPALAADAAPPARIQDFAWLAGRWSGPGMGGVTDQWVLEPADGQMAGMFRFVKDGKLVFTQHFAYAEAGDTVELRLRHFNPDFTSWEEKAQMVRFPLQSFGKNEARFGAVSYRRDGDRLTATVQMKSKDGVVADRVFEWVAVK
jgi:hypothetical protein